MPKVLLFITWGLYDWTWAAYELQIKLNNSIHSKNQKTVWLTFSWKTSFVCLLSVIVNWWLSFIKHQEIFTGAILEPSISTLSTRKTKTHLEFSKKISDWSNRWVFFIRQGPVLKKLISNGVVCETDWDNNHFDRLIRDTRICDRKR